MTHVKRTMLIVLAATFALGAGGCAQRCRKARENILQPMQSVMTYLGTNPSGDTLAESGCAFVMEEFSGLPQGADVIRKLAASRFSHVRTWCTSWQPHYRYVCERRYLPPPRPVPPPRRPVPPRPVPPRRPPRPVPPRHAGLEAELTAISESAAETEALAVESALESAASRELTAHVTTYYGPANYGGCHWVYVGQRCAYWEYDRVTEPGFAQAMDFARSLDDTYRRSHAMCAAAEEGNRQAAYDQSRALASYLETDVKPSGDTVYALACGR